MSLPQKCSQCDKMYETEMSLKEHIADVHLETWFKCHQCDKDFSSKSDLEEHIYTHNPVYHKCKQCGKMCKTAKCLERHISIIHSENRVECDECEKTFSNVGNLIQHQKQFHRTKDLGGPTKKRYHANKHFVFHMVGDRFKCDECDKDFSTKSNLRTHMKSHESSETHKCNQCGKILKRYRSLQTHILNSHSEKRLKCDDCERMFATIAFLNQHKRRVHVLKLVKCDQCNFQCKTNSQLKPHINQVHNGVLSKCDLCDFQGHKSNLKIHKESVHEKKKNWFCKTCTFSTYHKRSFIEHTSFCL